MIPTRQVDRETHVAGLLLKTEAALEEVHQYYKFGRHGGTFPERLYFLFSHCAHLLFSLWLTENESPAQTFEYAPHLKHAICEVDFGSLRFTDYKRRVLHANADEEHLKNEPQWFKSWMKILEAQSVDGSEFSQHVLTYVSDPGFLEGRQSRKNRKVLTELMTTDGVARLLRCTTSVLEQMVSAIVLQFASRHEPPHTAEQMTSLICLLRQVRRTILSDTPAHGPYIPLTRMDWAMPATVFRRCAGGTNGTLKTVVKRDGGDVVCTYRWTSGSEPKSASWTQKTSAPKYSYEERLFQTWAYDTGAQLGTPTPSAESYACWLIQSAEARHLKAITRQIKTVLTSIGTHPQCGGLIAAVKEVLVEDQPEWKEGRLAWTYIKKLDRLLRRLSTAHREASVLGGHDPGTEVAAMMWPSEPSACPPAKPPRSHTWRLMVPSRPSPHSETQGGSINQKVFETAAAPVEDHSPRNHVSDETCRPSDTSCQVDSSTPPESTESETIVVSQDDDRSLGLDHDGALPAIKITEEAVDGPCCDESGAGTGPDAGRETVASDDAVPNDTSDVQIPDAHMAEATDGEDGRDTSFLEPTSTVQPAGRETAHELPRRSEPTQQAAAETSAVPNAPASPVSSDRLRGALLQWHCPAGEAGHDVPMSRQQLQGELGWRVSDVQRMMTRLFGPRPFTVYKQKCKEKRVECFLKHPGPTPTQTRANTPETPCPATMIAAMVSDRAFCEQIAWKPQTDAENAEPELDRHRPDSPSEDRPAEETYQAYFTRVARQGTGAPVAGRSGQKGL